MPERDGSSTTTSTWGGTTTELNGDNIIQTARENSESRESIPGRSENRRNTETEKSEGGMNGHTTTTGPDSVEITASDKHQDRRRSSTTAEVHHINPLGLQIRSRPGRGNGVFATVRISAGTLVEESPVLLISAEQWEKGDMQRTIFGEYGFCWSGGGQAIGLGLASLFNHSSRPNVNFIRQTATSTIRFIAARTIEPDEELCICYSADESKLWFTPVGQSGAGETNMIAPPSPPPINNFPTFVSDDLLDSDEVAAREERVRKRLARIEEIRLSDQEKAKVEGMDAARRSVSGEMRNGLVNGSRSSSRSEADSSSSLSSSTYPVYPALPDRRPMDMPPPLHSGPSRQTSTIPAILCPDLDWREEDWTVEKGDVEPEIPDWTEVVRVKGPAELEEDAEDEGTLDVWVVTVDDPKLTRLVLDFCKENCPIDYRMRHLKRVARRTHSETGEPTTLIALCATYDSTLPALQAALSSYHPTLLDIQPFLRSVPASPARSAEQLKLKSPVWPVSYSAGTMKIADSSSWSSARKAWVHAGIQRVIAVARQAKTTGELPVGTFVSSPPEITWPPSDAFIPPTPLLRASATDTRASACHPLKHAALNCIREIATLRTQPPFSEMQPTRNGADYLLTSLTLFITHEPCVMCCMALLHSRVREVFYIIPRKGAGGFESAFGVHGRKDLNHRFEVWKYMGVEGEVSALTEELAIQEDTAL